MKNSQTTNAQSRHAHHSRVVAKLQRFGGTVTVSPYYSDNFIDKPSQIDIVATTAFSYVDGIRQRYGDIVLRLSIECKYVPLTTVFWFDGKDLDQAAKRVVSDTGLNEVLLHAHGTFVRHHYLGRDPVAKLFSSGPRSSTSAGSRRHDELVMENQSRKGGAAPAPPLIGTEIGTGPAVTARYRS